MTSPFTDSQLQEMAFQSDPTGAIARELLEARRDARRYRWLRDVENECNLEIPLADGTGYLLPGWDEYLDAAIDAALTEGK